MNREVRVTVNGEATTAPVEPRQLLVEYLRDTQQLTGTHIGCDTSTCGACTVLVDGLPTKSCSILTARADGTSVLTVEGLAHEGERSPVQEGFRACHGTQCGFAHRAC